jgi:hypothetical protein
MSLPNSRSSNQREVIFETKKRTTFLMSESTSTTSAAKEMTTEEGWWSTGAGGRHDATRSVDYCRRQPKLAFLAIGDTTVRPDVEDVMGVAQRQVMVRSLAPAGSRRSWRKEKKRTREHSEVEGDGSHVTTARRAITGSFSKDQIGEGYNRLRAIRCSTHLKRAQVTSRRAAAK